MSKLLLIDTERDHSRREAIKIYSLIVDYELKDDFAECVKDLIRKVTLVKQSDILRKNTIDNEYKQKLSEFLDTCLRFLKGQELQALGEYLQVFSKIKLPSKKTPLMQRYYSIIKECCELYDRKLFYKIVIVIDNFRIS